MCGPQEPEDKLDPFTSWMAYKAPIMFSFAWIHWLLFVCVV